MTSKQWHLRRSIVIVSALVTAAAFSSQPEAGARGFGGGGGRGFGGGFGGGGGFDGGRGFGGGFDGGRFGDRFDARTPGEFGDRAYGGDSPGDDSRPSAFSTPYGGFRNADAGRPGVSDTGVRDYGGADRFGDGARDLGAGRAGDSGIRDWNGGTRALSTDGGFGRLASGIPAGAGAVGRGLVGRGNVTRRMTAPDLATRGSDVRRAFRHYDAFTRDWWARHANAWWWNRWWNNWAWTWCDWPVLAGFWGVPVDDEPDYYDYGDNITYQGNQVYYGSQPIEPADQYYDQAQTLATSVPDGYDTLPADQSQTGPVKTASGADQTAVTADDPSKKWKSLGTFSLVQGSQTDTTTMFQLAVDKKARIRGNYYNVLTDEVKPIRGAIDKKLMRVCWTVGNDKKVVYDTGVANLLKDQSPILVHLGRDTTQQWTLVRLKQPAGK